MYRALIVCNHSFPASKGKLQELHGPKRDGHLLRDALTDPVTGMFERANVREPLSDAASQEILEAAEEFFESAAADDTLLFYYSGHGYARGQELYLCARNTDLDKVRTTTVPSSVLKSIVDSSTSVARTRILVFDCCNSALFKGQGEDDDEDEITKVFGGTGRYVLSATSAAERAADGAWDGAPSPFTQALTDALRRGVEDLDKDGNVDLDDVYRYLKGISFETARPHQNFDGEGSIPIARRAVPEAPDAPSAGTQDDSSADTKTPRQITNAQNVYNASGDIHFHHLPEVPGPDRPYLDRPVPGAAFSPALVAEFRRSMRPGTHRRLPPTLADEEFLKRAGLLISGSITNAGLLMFSEHPTQVQSTAIVHCLRFHGTSNTASRDVVAYDDPIPQLIDNAYAFVQDVARVGDEPTDNGTRAEPVYKYAMVAVREIIANAVIHRDYENNQSCVQIHAFEDRIEVHSPGTWQGEDVAPGSYPLSALRRDSARRNFQIAQTLTWSGRVEGAGTGVDLSVEVCEEAGAPEPLVTVDARGVKVTIFPRSQQRQQSGSQGSVLPAIWGSQIPYRNPHFFGRERELQALHDQLTAGTGQPPAVLHGLGGIGKTQIAAEYAHRHAADYDLVWWIPAAGEDHIWASLAELSSRLGLNAGTQDEDSLDQASWRVVNLLQSGNPNSRWLLIFDDVTELDKLRRYLPQGAHVILTSRISEWRRTLQTGGIEVQVFPRAETIRFLSGRIRDLADGGTPGDDTAMAANRLAEAIGDLPVAAAHAAAYINATGSSVADYIAALEHAANNLLSQETGTISSVDVESIVGTATSPLPPDTRALFELLAFFGPAPIAIDLLSRNGLFAAEQAFAICSGCGDLMQVPDLFCYNCGRSYKDSADNVLGKLQTALSSHDALLPALRALARHSLVDLNARQDTVRMHRVVQAVTRDQLQRVNPDRAAALRAAVWALLASSDPGNLELESNGPAYERSLPHLVPSGAATSDSAAVGNLVLNQVRRLRMHGRNDEALGLGQAALSHWSMTRPDHPQTRDLADELANAQSALDLAESVSSPAARQRRRSTAIIYEKKLIPLGAAVTLELEGIVNQESAQRVKQWFAANPELQNVTWSPDSREPLVWAAQPDRKWTLTALRNEIFRQAGLQEPTFSAGDAWCYNGRSLWVIADEAFYGSQDGTPAG